MHVILTVVGGKADRRQVRVKVPVMIGRSREAGLVVAHPMVSRRHCELFFAGGVLRIRDLGSLNGVYVGGRRVVEAPLPPRSEFSIGPLTLRVDYSPELLAQQAAREVEAPPAEEPKPAEVPPPPDRVTPEVGEFDLEEEFLAEAARADQPGFFPAIPERAVEHGPETAPGEQVEESSSERKHSEGPPTLFPEDFANLEQLKDPRARNPEG